MRELILVALIAAAQGACLDRRAASARALLGPLSRARVAASLGALPGTVLSGRSRRASKPARLRVDVRLRSYPGAVRVDLQKSGRALSVSRGRGPKTLVWLPVAADADASPLVRARPSFAGTTRVTILLQTLAARVAADARRCRGRRTCLRAVAAERCGVMLPADAPASATARVLAGCGAADAGALGWVPGTLYRLLFALMATAQMGAFLWGAAFAATAAALEAVRRAEGVLKCGARGSRRLAERLLKVAGFAPTG